MLRRGRRKEKVVENWLKSVSAFANGTGGVLVFGKAEDGTVAGAKDMRTATKIIRKKIKECIVPFPHVVLKLRKADSGKEVMLLEVSPGKELPYFYTDGKRIQAYIRAGKENIPAGTQELKRMILRSEDISYDSVETNYNAEEFSFSELIVSYQEWTGDVIGREELENMNLIRNGHLTNAGLLFADESPAASSRLRCIKWNGTDKSGGKKSITDRALYTGNLFMLLNKGIWFIKKNMKVLWTEEDGKKTEHPDYHDISIFEGLVNALAHRDYLMTKSEIRIDLYDDHLTISSPGGMPDGSFAKDNPPEQVHPSSRNPVLAHVFTQIGYMTQEGIGFDKIKIPYSTVPAATPRYHSTPGQFTLTLQNLNYRQSPTEEPDSQSLTKEPDSQSLTEEPDSQSLTEEPISQPLTEENVSQSTDKESSQAITNVEDGKEPEKISQPVRAARSIQPASQSDVRGNNTSHTSDNTSHTSNNTSYVSNKTTASEANASKLEPKDAADIKPPSGQLALNENEKKVLSVITDQPAISTDNISLQTQIAKRTVERTLQSLKKKGILTRQGSRRSGTWLITP